MYPQNDILARMRRRRVLEPPVGSTPPIALEQDAEMGRADPWSERLPDGRTVNEAILETLKRSSAVPLGGSQTRTAPDTAIPLGSSSTPSSAVPLGGKRFESGSPAPDEQEFTVGQETRPAIVGGSRNPNPLTREAARIRTMLEHPSRKVSPDGSAGTSEKLGRWKAIGLGLLRAGAMIRPGASNAEALATLATGGVIGAVSPSSIQDWNSRIEAEGAQERLAKHQKTALGQAQIESEQAETRQRQMAPEIALIEAERKARYDRERLRVQEQVAEGRMSTAEAARKFREMELEERKRHNLETEGTARARIQAAPDKSAETEAKREAFLKEVEDTKNNAEIYEGNAETNEQMANAEPKIQDSMGEETESPRAKELRKTAAEFRSEAQKLRAKIPSLRSKAESIPAADKRRGTAPYRGRTMSAANLERYAKDKGISVEEARQRVEAQGIKVR